MFLQYHKVICQYFFLNLDKEPAFDKKGNPWMWTGVGFFQGFHRGELRMGI